MTKQFTKRSVQIANQSGGIFKEITADCLGAIAVHPSVEYRSEAWTLTHIPTGCGIASAPNSRLAKKAARALADIDLNWDAVTVKTCKTKKVRSVVRPALGKLQAQGVIY